MIQSDKQKVIEATLAALSRFGAALDVPVHPSFGMNKTVRQLIEDGLKDEETYKAIGWTLRTKQKREHPEATLESVVAELNSDEAIRSTLEFYTSPRPGSGALPPRPPKGPGQ